ncbi:MAG: hypothetical protein AAFY29_23340 [Pseudomonadota bacterium]
MNLITVLSVALGVSFFVSAVLALLILPPVKQVLAQACDTGDGVLFWTRFSIIMLFLGPMIVTLLFGVPSEARLQKLSDGDVIVGVVTSSFSGAFLTIGGIGLRLGTLRGMSGDRMREPIKRNSKTDDDVIT